MKGRWWKRGGLFLSVLALINISAPFSELLPIAYAYTCPDKSTAASQAECPTVANSTSTPSSVDFSAANISFTRVNRTLIKVGEAWFTSDDPTGDNYTYTSVGLECSAKLTYKPETNSGDNYSSSTWTIEYKKYLTSTKTCDSATTTKSLPNDPTNNGENQRYWTVFYKNGNKVYSVLKDNSTTFTKKGTINGVDVYIEDGKEATACPQLITNRGSEWLYIPIKHVDSADVASNEYAGAMKQLLGVSEGVNCNPTGDSAEKEGLLNGFGLPKDYFKRGKVNEHDGYHPLGFSNNYMHGAVLAGGMPGTEAAGIGANGPNANGKGVGNGKTSSSSSGSGEGKTTCSVAGIGWIVCPVLTFLGTITDESYKIISDEFLSVDTSLISSTSDTYKAWQSFRNIANIAFVLIFLIIIYSQVTSAGISNYGVKRMLPRLIIAAILVNLSFLLCQIAVDISQILGYNIKAFLDSAVTPSDGSSGGTWVQIGEGLTWALIIAGGLIASGLAILAISIPVLLASLLAVLMIVLILIGRKAIIVLLVVVSPIAFVAYLLPNTEKWFKKWWDMLFSMLMLFPLISLVFGASKLAGNILANTADENPALQAAAIGAATIPFFVVPGMLKGALTATGALGAKLQGLGNKATQRVGARVKDSSRIGTGIADMKRYRDQKRAINYATKRGKGAMSVIGGTPFIGGGKGYNAHARNRASDLEAEERSKNIAAYDRNLVSDTKGNMDQIVAIANDTSAPSEQRAAAIARVFRSGGYDDKKKVVERAGTAEGKIEDDQTRDMLAAEYSKSNLSAAFGSSVAGSLAKGDTISLNDAAGKNFADLDSAKLTSHPNVARDVAHAYKDASYENKQKLIDAMANLEKTPEQMSKLTPDARASLRQVDPTFGLKGNNISASPSKTSDTSDVEQSSSQSQSSTVSTPQVTPLTQVAKTSTERAFSRDQIKTMGPENVQRAVEARGGMTAMSDGDVLSIRNSHGSHEVGQAARDEAIRRSLVTPPPNRPNLP